jgi:predicted tellurium resistance membrane protein TerC
MSFTLCKILERNKYIIFLLLLVVVVVGFGFMFTTIKIVRIKHILMFDLTSCNPVEHK